ncbi:hypothetical protein ABDI30_19030 [Paenibacillus cisolokensis]|uniref:hypothetical protein n=1 Tax=Paenibacillus cisolokensis TaxID=1658519 RepID=UPI003D271933
MNTHNDDPKDRNKNNTRSHPKETKPLVTERDIDAEFGLFAEEADPSYVPLPESVKQEKPDGSPRGRHRRSST